MSFVSCLWPICGPNWDGFFVGLKGCFWDEFG